MSDCCGQYLYIAVLGGFLGFVYAFAIGANDVANSFGSTVASGSLSLGQAVVVAGIFEFVGAIGLGGAVTGAVRGKIFDTSLYTDEPDIVMLGMFTSLLTGSIMLLSATYFSLPVSTTHTIVGSIMGFTIAAKGFDSVQWGEARKIFVSWGASPLVSGAVGFLFFGAIRMFVLRSENAFQRAYYAFPFVLFAAVGIDCFYILYKGMKHTDFYDKLELSWVIPLSWGVGVVVGVLWLWPVGPIVKQRIEDHMAERAQQKAVKDIEEAEDADNSPEDNQELMEAGDHPVTTTKGAEKPEEPAGEKEYKSSFHKWATKIGENTVNQDLQSQSMHENQRAALIWEKAERFDEDAEQLFTYVQVFTACLNSFAHGANDVANAIAPVASIIDIYQKGTFNSKAPTDKWILAYGGAGLAIGFFVFGYRTLKSIGYKLTMLSPSRGACAELASSLFIVTASFLEIPVSSTQCITGAVSGVGLVSGWRNVQWFFLARVCIGWAGVFFTAVLVNAGVFSLFAFSPSLQ